MRDAFLDAGEALRAAKSTLSRRSLAKNPFDHTKRLIRIFEAIWSLNRFRDIVAGIGGMDQQILTAREMLRNAPIAVIAGDLRLASQRVTDCAALIDRAEAHFELTEHFISMAEAVSTIVREEEDCQNNQAPVENEGGFSSNPAKLAV